MVEIDNIKEKMKDFEINSLDDIMRENASMISFVQAIRQYFLASRDNIAFIYTNKVNTDNDIPLIFPYQPGETIIDMFRKFTR
jgi:hypothetical protein